MRKVTVHASKNYDILIEKGLFSRVGEWIAPFAEHSRIAILTDDTVDALYGEKLLADLTNAGYSAVKFSIPHGETSKSPEKLFEFLNFLAENHLTRSDLLIALGGGVVGDLCGFAASVYLRGVRFIQIPTTLLAAVDSSVGGKTAVDIPAGKNLVGTFWQPDLVVCDPDLLKSLPHPIFRDGCAEVIKYGVILDRAFYERLRSPVWEDPDAVIERCVQIKRDVVEQDERDSGLRGLLNYGHTFGHGIEKYSNFTVSHGSAVAVGMVLAAKAAVHLGMTDPQTAKDIESVVRSYGFDTDCPYTADQLYDAALSDKKRSGETITLVLPKEIGACVLHKIPCTELLPILRAIL
ncbi:MAG: 3-dehydroquinate synthase [Eubacteriales bacterium]